MWHKRKIENIVNQEEKGVREELYIEVKQEQSIYSTVIIDHLLFIII